MISSTVMTLAVIPAIYALVKQWRLKRGISVPIDSGRLVVEPKPRPRYTLAELLAASDYSQPQPPDQREWVGAPAVGAELI